MLCRVADKAVVDFSYIAPVRSFFNTYHLKIAFLLLALIGLYRISDIVLGVISNVFYQDMGFTKQEMQTRCSVRLLRCELTFNKSTLPMQAL